MIALKKLLDKSLRKDVKFMWTEKSSIPSSDYERRAYLPKPYPLTKINGIPKFSKRKQIFKKWEEIGRILPEKKKFGISLLGIRVKKEEITIDPEKLKPNVFYLFSYIDEKYVTRKTDEGIVEVFEVVE